MNSGKTINRSPLSGNGMSKESTPKRNKLVRSVAGNNLLLKTPQKTEAKENNANGGNFKLSSHTTPSNNLLKRKEGSLFLELVTNGKVLEVKEHLKRNPSLHNQLGEKNRTALHIACNSGKQEIVDLLLACPGIQVNCLDNELHSPLHFASRWGK